MLSACSEINPRKPARGTEQTEVKARILELGHYWKSRQRPYSGTFPSHHWAHQLITELEAVATARNESDVVSRSNK